MIPWCAESDQFTDATARSAPLFPVAHADATPEPMIHFHGIAILQSDTEVVHPALKGGTDFSVPPLHGDAPTAACKTAQFGLEAREGFLRDGKPFTSEGKSEAATFLGLHHPALVFIDRDLEFSFKEPADTCHHLFSGTPRLHQEGEVIGIPGELMSPSLQFLIEIIQKDIAQEGR